MAILYVFFAVLLFTALVINKNTAKYLLSGYNTMTIQQQNSFPLNDFIAFFRAFMLFLSFSYLVIGLAVYFAVSYPYFIMYCLSYPLIGVMILFYKSSIYYQDKRAVRWVIFIGLVLLFAMLGSIGMGLKPAKVLVKENQLYVSGVYGPTLDIKDIQAVTTVASPQIRNKIKGFEFGVIKKGEFELDDNRRAIVLTTGGDSCLLISTESNYIFIDFDENTLQHIREKLNR